MNRPDEKQKCPECGGTGTIIVFSPMLDRVDEVPTRCPRCGGTNTVSSADPLPKNGTGV
jgi:DnaJ-class molecular chaperone